MKKTFDLSETTLQQIELIRVEKGFATTKQTLEFIIQAYPSINLEEAFADAVVKALDKKYVSKERLRWSLQTAEQNTIVILDILNTYLLRNHIDKGIPVDVLPSPVIENSRNRIKEKLAHFKQQADDKKAKMKHLEQN
ncbi:MAG: MSL1 family protein [Lachnospiraceae bacterium]|nr:MSL1 family protein [Lachnospiraceae bacterium]